MAAGQEWCLQCGAGAPGSLGGSAWRPALSVLGAVLVLVLGAGAAAYAALSKGSPKPRVLTRTVAQAPAPTVTTPTTPATGVPLTPGAATTTPKPATGLPGLGSGKPPKIPLTAVTPKASEKAITTPTGAGTKSTPTKATKPAGTPADENPEASEEAQAAIELDTNAAKTYDPYGYPASWFGDPSLAIDGDPSTPWTAQVDPATAPRLAEGLLIDLKSKQKVAVAQVTGTRGMTVQVYGTSASKAPESITDPAWVALTGPRVLKKHTLRMPLRDSKKAFTFVVLWLSKAPTSAIGTAEAPGHVSVDEVELFPTP